MWIDLFLLIKFYNKKNPFVYSSVSEHDRLIDTDMPFCSENWTKHIKIVSDFAQQLKQDSTSWRKKKRHNVIPMITLEELSRLWCREREHTEHSGHSELRRQTLEWGKAEAAGICESVEKREITRKELQNSP